MSSPDIKIQSILRNYKSAIKEDFNKQKIISEFTYKINNDNILSIKNITSLKDIMSFEDTIKQEISKENSEENSEETSQKNEIDEYIGYSNIFANIYNSEFCNEEWVAFLYFISKNYINFQDIEGNVHIKSLFLNNISILSAFHHFLYNSNEKLDKLDCKWCLATYYYKKHEIRKEYHNNVLKLQDKQLYSINNINYIINEITSSYSKVNFLINTNCSYNDYISCAILAIKLLDNNCLFYCKIPKFDNFTDEIKDVLLLYSLIFEESYIYSFDLKSQMNYLVCKNKKKINTDSIYKKLLSLQNSLQTKYPIFLEEFKKENDLWISNLDKIISEPQHNKIIRFDIIKKEINDVLGYNYKTLS